MFLDELIGNSPFITQVYVAKNKGYGYGILSGLHVSSGGVLAWTHADMQTDPKDILEGLELFMESGNQENLFVKGRQYGRPFIDVFFTHAMAFFETILLPKVMLDINAQPTMFHRNFFDKWENPPFDLSLDLYVY